MAQVPDVTGLTQLAAKAALETDGLLLGAVTTESHATVPAGAVIRQSPLAGTSVLRGSAVDVVLSLGPVPDTTAPAIAIASPGANAAYALNQSVLASYTCTDASGIAFCTGTVANGAAIDTSSAGLKTFCVTAVDGVGNTSPSPQCVSYSVLAPPPVGGSLLGSAQRFAVLGGSTVTNTGATVVTGDLGASPGIAVTGFPPGVVVGTIHAGDTVALQAQVDLTAAYNNLAGRASTSLMSGVDLGGKTLVAGVYTFAVAAGLTGDLTLDAQGNASAVFIFQIGSTLTTAGNSSVRLLTTGTIHRGGG